MLSVELNHLSQMLNATNSDFNVSATAAMLSDEIKQAIYDHAIITHPQYGKVFACRYIYVVLGGGSNC
jgi:meiotically up-regulated gene 157 (Mug157) protein